MATKLGPVPLLVLLTSCSSALRVIDTGLGHNWQAVSDDKLIKDFAVLSEGDNNATLPSDLTICASMSTSDARNPAALFQLLSDEFVPWINICILFAVKTAKVHKIKAQVSWFFSLILYEVHKGLNRTPSFSYCLFVHVQTNLGECKNTYKSGTHYTQHIIQLSKVATSGQKLQPVASS